jgi:hypothetical protein
MTDNRTPAIRNGIAVGLALFLLSGCGEDSGGSIAQPITGTPPPATTAPAQPTGTSQIAGEVFSAMGPVVGAGISIWAQAPQFGQYWHWNGQLVTDEAGRFSVSGLADATKITIKVLDDAYRQPCVANVDASTSQTVRVEVVPVGDFDAIDPPRPLTARDPSLTGTVYEIATGIRKPVGGAQVRILNDADIPIATALTGREGRYYLCDLPTVVVVAADKVRYAPVTVRPVDATKGIPLDIELHLQDDF